MRLYFKVVMPVYLLIALIYLSGFLGLAQGQDTQLLDILQRFERTKSSQLHPDGIETLVLTGSYHTQGQVLSISLKQKDPSNLRLEYKQDGFDVIIGYNGEVGWQRKEKGDFVSIRDYIPGEYDWLKMMADLRGYLLRFLAGEAGISVTILESVKIEGRKMHVILASDKDYQMKYYLNMVTSNLEKIEVLSSDGSVGETTTFKDYRMIDGIPMFHRQEFKNAEGKTHTYYWDKIEINSVVYDFVFEKPKY